MSSLFGRLSCEALKNNYLLGYHLREAERILAKRACSGSSEGALSESGSLSRWVEDLDPGSSALAAECCSVTHELLQVRFSDAVWRVDTAWDSEALWLVDAYAGFLPSETNWTVRTFEGELPSETEWRGHVTRREPFVVRGDGGAVL